MSARLALSSLSALLKTVSAKFLQYSLSSGSLGWTLGLSRSHWSNRALINPRMGSAGLGSSRAWAHSRVGEGPVEQEQLVGSGVHVPLCCQCGKVQPACTAFVCLTRTEAQNALNVCHYVNGCSVSMLECRHMGTMHIPF